MKRIAVASSLLVLFASHSLRADDTPTAPPAKPIDNTVREAAEEIQKHRANILETEQEKRRILGSLYDISKRMKKITQEKSHLTDKLLRAQGSVQNIAKGIAKLEQEIEGQQKLLRHRFRDLYKISGQSFLAVIFSQNSAQSLDQSLKFLKIVSDKDFSVIKSYKKNIADFKNRKQNLNAEVKKLVVIEGEIKKQETLLQSEHQQKSDIVTEIEAKKLVNIEKIKNIRTKTVGQSDHFDAAVADLLKPAIFESKGQLPPPVQGSLVRDFGLVKDKDFLVELSHKGWQYECAKGSEVQSIFDGKIAYVGNIEGFGPTVIVDHGDHYYSVYSHVAGIKAKLGEVVKKSQILATVGPVSSSNSSGLYFEIRHFSEPENPKQWIAPQNVNVSLQGAAPI